MDITIDLSDQFLNRNSIYTGPSLRGVYDIRAYLYSDRTAIPCNVVNLTDRILFRGTYHGVGIIELVYIKLTQQYILSNMSRPFHKNKWSMIIEYEEPSSIDPVGKAVHKTRSFWSRLFGRKQKDDYSHLRISGGNKPKSQDTSSDGSIRSVVFRD